MSENLDDWNQTKEGKGRHRHMNRNEEKTPPKADEANVPDQSETTPNPGKERVLKGHTLPVTLKAARRIQSEADKHADATIAQDVKRDSMSSAEHSSHTHA
jgi:hypothetical protein